LRRRRGASTAVPTVGAPGRPGQPDRVRPGGSGPLTIWAVEVRSATLADVDPLSEVLTRAFHDDVTWDWILAGGDRAAAMRRFYRVVVRRFIRSTLARAQTTDDLPGVA